MRVTVNWCLWRDTFDSVEGEELLVTDPIPVLKFYQENESATFRKCPAYINYYKNTFVVCSPIDCEIEINKEKGWANIIEPKNLPKSRLNPRFGDENESPYPIFSLRINRLLVTTSHKDVYVEQTEPVLEWDRATDIRVIAGNFNISKWVRPLELAFEQKTKNVKVVVKRGQPLYYMRFITSDPDDIVVLNKIEMTKDIFDDAQRCLAVKEFTSNSSLKYLYELRAKFMERFNGKN